MKMIPEHFILIKLFTFAGYHPDCSYWHRKITFLIGLFLYGVPLSLAIKGLFFYQKDLILLTECLQATFLFADSFFRHVMLHSNSHNINSVLEMQKEIWKIEDLSSKSEGFIHLGRKTIKWYLLAALVIFLGFAIQPFIIGKLPATTYVPEGYFWKLSVFYSFTGLGVIVTILTTDALFCSFCISGIVQFVELKGRLKNLKKKEWRGKIKECVEHHNLLTGYCILINKVYIGIFLIYFIFSTGATCMQIYISTNSEIPLAGRIKNWLYFSEQLSQSVLYCTFSELVSGAALDIADAVYDSQWYNIDESQLKKSVCLMIAKAQKKIVFTGYGLVEINLKTFVVILKTAMSFYTYLNSV